MGIWPHSCGSLGHSGPLEAVARSDSPVFADSAGNYPEVERLCGI